MVGAGVEDLAEDLVKSGTGGSFGVFFLATG